MSWLKFSSLFPSPISRPPPQSSTTVNDGDFSYITNDDLRRHAVQNPAAAQAPPTDSTSERDVDTILLKGRKKDYVVQLPANSIANGDLRIKTLREAVAQKMGLTPSSVKLTYKGRVLKNDRLQCRAEGLRSGSEVLCSNEDSDFLSDLDDEDEDDAGPTTSKKKRNRNNRNKKKGRPDVEDDGGSSNLSVGGSQPRGVSPGVSTGSSTPLTAKEKLIALRATLQSYDQDVQAFLSNPPADQTKREFDRKRISETLLTQILLKTDAIETEGDAAARTSRKELVKDTQDILKQLDDAHGGQLP